MAAGDEERHIEVPLNARRTADVEAACWAGEWQVNGEAAMAAGTRTGTSTFLSRGGPATYWNGSSSCCCG
jgi:hypothetical protein